MNYRPDIDGLRAIAIFLVLIYHGGLSLFPSGFIGVDVFFVISGFLITRIIHESLDKHRFSFIYFYNRRLWRLQPVFIMLLLLTTLGTLLLYLPEDLLQFSRSVRNTSLFVSNLFFNRTTTGYFSPDTHQLPLLHTWSLSIEWQCYLLLPVLMYCLHKMFNKNTVIKVIYLLTLIALLLSLYNKQEFPAHTYYQLTSRIFEFLIGSCMVFIPLKIKAEWIVNVLGGFALFIIFYIARLDHILPAYPNEYALYVCMATGLLIALGRFYPACCSSKLLSFSPLVFIGLLSYSLYLWHWPVFALLRYQNITETPAILLTAYSLIFILSYGSWRFIEKPARTFQKIKFHNTVILLLVFPILMTHASAYFIKRHQGFPQRFNQELVQVYEQLKRYSSNQRPLCISNNKEESASQCTLGSKKTGSKTGLMIGDSFSNHYWGFMDVLGQAANVSILAQGTSSCLVLPEIYLYNWWYYKNQVYQECYDQTKKYYQMIQDGHYDYVIIGQIWSNYLSESIIHRLGDKRSLTLAKKRIEQALDEALHKIIISGARPLLIKTSALMEAHTSDCFFKHIKLRRTYHPEQCRFPLVLSKSEQWFGGLFARMKNKYPQLIVIDPKKVQCPKGVCPADIQGIPVYRDVGHITDYASYQLGTLYLQKFKNPLM